MSFKYELSSVLEELGQTRNWLAVESKVRPGTIYDLHDGKTKRIELETMERILYVLNSYAKQKGIEVTYTLDSLISYTDEETAK